MVIKREGGGGKVCGTMGKFQKKIFGKDKWGDPDNSEPAILAPIPAK